MKRLIIFPIVCLLFASSCKKMDLQQPPVPEATENGLIIDNPPTSGLADWKTVNTWSAGNLNTITGEIGDLAITKDISENGIVLVYTKDGNTVHQLPYSEKSAGKSYSWYYQVADGKITISLEGSDEITNSKKQQSFTYLILSADQLENLESKGLSNGELFQLPYDRAVAGFDNR